MTEAERKQCAAKPTVYCLRYYLDGENTLVGVYSTIPRAEMAANVHYHGDLEGEGATPWSQLHRYGYWLDIMKLDAPAIAEPDWQNIVREP